VIDTHCHLDVGAFDADRDDALARARRAGVRGVVVPAIRPSAWARLVAWAAGRRAVGVRVAIGVHPQVVPELDEDERAAALDPARLAAAARAAGAVAIGECGLDGKTGDRAGQEAVLRAHVRAAREVGLPLVVHVLGAHDVAPRLLAEERAQEVGGVMHSYSGGRDLVARYVELGLHVAFAGPVTYANARRPVEAARAVPRERLLVETDAPDQAPVPHRGGRSEPAFLPRIVEGVARARAEDPADVARYTDENAARLFRLR